MDRDEIVAALTALGRRLDGKGITGEMVVVGGAAIALAYAERRSTRDVDAVFEPKLAIYEASEEVAEELGLPPGWLNDAVKAFLVDDPEKAFLVDDPEAVPVLSGARPRGARSAVLRGIASDVARDEGARSPGRGGRG